MKLKFKINKKLRIVLISFILTILICLPYMNGNTITTHDISYHTTRIVSIAEELKNGQFPVVIASNLLHGFGYCNELFYPELFLYIPAVLVLIGIDFLASYKIFILLTTFFTLIISYYSSNLIFKNKYKSWMFTILYGTAYYRLTDTFVRGALGEVLAMVFLPLVISGIYEIIFGDNKRWWVISLGLFGIVNSHVLTLVMCAVLIIILVLINVVRIFKDKKRLINLILAGIISVLLAASFIFPYLEQAKSDYYNVDEKIYSPEFLEENAVSISEMLNNVPNDTNYYKGMGVILIIISLLIVFQFKNKDENAIFMKELFIIGILVYFISSRFFPWQKLCTKFNSLTTMQFPYRLNILSSVLFAFVASYSITAISGIIKNKKTLYSIYTVLIIFSIIFIHGINFNGLNLEHDDILSFAPVGNGEYKPYGLTTDDKYVHNIASDEHIEFEKNGTKLEFYYDDSENDMIIHIPLTYYKGYVSYIEKDDGSIELLEVEEAENTKNIIIKSENNIKGKVTIEYQKTFIQKISYMITFVTLVFVIINMIYFVKVSQVIEETSEVVKEIKE